MSLQEIPILLVEDNENDRVVIEKNIAQSLPEVKLEVVSSVYEAAAALKENLYDLIITEHRPPELDSFHLLLSLNRNKQSVPVIVITGHGDERTAVEAMKRGAYDYFPKGELQHLSIGHVIETVLERKKLKDELEAKTKKLEEMAARDGLTDLYNHRHYCELVQREFRRAQRYHHPLSLMMLDLDFFKSINDTYGHRAGDRVLFEVGRLITNSLRNVDIVARYGGDEFSVAMPETTLTHAVNLAHRIQKLIASHKFEVPGGEAIHVSTSIGVTTLSQSIQSKDDLISSADRALYRAKKQGRSAVCSDAEVFADEPLLVNSDALKELNNRIMEISNRMKQGYMEQIFEFLKKLPFADTEEQGHSEEVSKLAASLAKKLGLSEQEVYSIRVAGLLHDIGKVAIDQNILKKKGALTDQEYQLLQRHPVIGAQILQQFKFMDNEVPMVLHHHERFDGYGYPSRLKGFEIPLGARILSLAETWDSMRSNQPYRKALSIKKVRREIELGAGTQFDGNLAQIFLDMVS